MLLLDWEKAFDSISFSSIREALARLGVPVSFVQAIMAIYSAPQFRVKDSGYTSELGTQRRGVRQGCPLSPYLFDVVLTCLFRDVEQSYEQQCGILVGVLAVPSRLWDLEYADDMVLMSHSFTQLNRLLHLLQYHALKIRLQLQLNLEKCKRLRIHSENRIAYAPDPSQPCQCRCCAGVSSLERLVPWRRRSNT